MPHSARSSYEIHIGDRVAYRLIPGEPAHEATGKLIGLVVIQNGQIMADVEWDRLGPPKRLKVTALTKA